MRSITQLSQRREGSDTMKIILDKKEVQQAVLEYFEKYYPKIIPETLEPKVDVQGHDWDSVSFEGYEIKVASATIW